MFGILRLSGLSAYYLAVLKSTFLFEFYDRLYAVTQGRSSARNLRGENRFQQFAFRGAMRDSTTHMGDNAFWAATKSKNANHDHFTIFDGQGLAVSRGIFAQGLSDLHVLRVFLRQPLRPRITVGTGILTHGSLLHFVAIEKKSRQSIAEIVPAPTRASGVKEQRPASQDPASRSRQAAEKSH